MAGTSKKESWTAHDGACSNCRNRKTKCSREKPRCSNCCRDQVECVYSSPPKRVNHVKVLCQNFDDIQDRLTQVQEELVVLTSLFTKSDIADRLKIKTGRGLSSEDDLNWPGPGHVVRDDCTLIERYHGPWTLVSECRDFEAAFTPPSGTDDATQHIFKKMLFEVGAGDLMDMTSEEGQDAIRLPPRQFLSVMLDSFFQQVDYSTDIFVRSIVDEAVDRVYRSSTGDSSESWTVCFNLIIALVLGAEHPIRGDDPFVRPVLQAVKAAARKPSFFMSPRLISVQALALLSLVAQQSHMGSLGDSMFAQACILAKSMGLHQGVFPSGLSADECEEREKLVKSLYIRDRCSAVARGTPLWLPCCSLTPPHDPLPTLSSAPVANTDIPLNQAHGPHWELAGLQNQLHRLLFQRDVHSSPTSEGRIALTRVQQGLEEWSQRYRVPTSSRPRSIDTVLLHLGFLGTRMRAFGCQSPGSISHDAPNQVLQDARMCCLIVITSCNILADGSKFLERLDQLHGSIPESKAPWRDHRPLISSISSSPSPAVRLKSEGAQPKWSFDPPDSKLGRDSTPTTTPLHRLVNDFPHTAFFVIARNILEEETPAGSGKGSTPNADSSAGELSHIHEDTMLLEGLLLCFRGATDVTGGETNNHISRLTHVIRGLVDIVRVATHHDGLGNDMSYDHSKMGTLPTPVLTPPMSLAHDAAAYGARMPNPNTYNTDLSSSDFSPYGGMDNLPYSGVTWSHDSPPQSATTSSSVSMAPASFAEAPFDISQFLKQLGTTPMWDGAAHADLMMQAQNVVAEPMGNRRRKRPRIDTIGDVEGDDSN